jgi:hypothetical protein
MLHIGSHRISSADLAPAQMAAEIDANISSLVKTANVKDAALKGASFDMILTPSAGDALWHAFNHALTHSTTDDDVCPHRLVFSKYSVWYFSTGDGVGPCVVTSF